MRQKCFQCKKDIHLLQLVFGSAGVHTPEKRQKSQAGRINITFKLKVRSHNDKLKLDDRK